MARSITEILGRAALIGGLTLSGAATANKVVDISKDNPLTQRIPLVRLTPPTPASRLPDPRSVQNQQEQVSTMQRLAGNLKKYLAPFTADMERYDVRVQSPMLLSSRRNATVERETLEAFDLPSQNGRPLTEYTLKKGNSFAYDGHVAVLSPDDTESFWAITYNSLVKQWVFRPLYETTPAGERDVFAKENP